MKFFKISNTSKQNGSTLIVAVVVAAMLLTIGIGAAKILVKDVEFSADLMLSEKAYFAAESGIEKALLDLNVNPVQNMNNVEINIDTNTKVSLDIENSLSEFSFDLSPNASQKFRLLKDTKKTNEYEPTIVDTFNLEVKPAGHLFQWKILCRDKEDSSKTISMIGQEDSANFSDFFNHPDKNNNLFSSWVKPDKKTCFFSVQNLSNKALNFEFKSPSKMSPHKTHVHAMGRAGNREKHISFDYSQNNLGSLFDFVLFHTDKGFSINTEE